MVGRGKFGTLRIGGICGVTLAILFGACAGPTRTLAAGSATPPVSSAGPPARADLGTLRFATLAPKNSSVGRMLTVWEKALAQRTNGRLTLTIFYNGVAGMEDGVLAKMRAGQLEGAALSAAGLVRANRSAGVLMLPGLATRWVETDQIRKAIEPDLDAGFQRAGFRRIGWGDLGLVRLFTKGFAARHPRDLMARVAARCELLLSLGATVSNPGPLSRGAPVSAGALMQQLKGRRITPLFNNANANAVCSPASAFHSSLWPGFDHLHDDPIASSPGAILFDSQTLALLPRDLLKVFDEIGARVSSALVTRLRNADDQAYQKLAQAMTVVTRTPAERAAWDGHYRTTIVSIVQRGALDKALVNKALQARGLAPIP